VGRRADEALLSDRQDRAARAAVLDAPLLSKQIGRRQRVERRGYAAAPDDLRGDGNLECTPDACASSNPGREIEITNGPIHRHDVTAPDHVGDRCVSWIDVIRVRARVTVQLGRMLRVATDISTGVSSVMIRSSMALPPGRAGRAN
jgi:hypothetical protein